MAGRDGPVILITDEARRRKAQQLQRRTRRVRHFRQGPGHGVIDVVVRITLAHRHRTGDDARRDKAGQVVDVAVGVVVQQAVTEPQHLARAQRLRQRRPGRGLAPAGVAVGVQQALARGDDRPLTVVIQRPTLENEAVTVQRHAGGRADLVRDGVVMLELVLSAPAVEAEGGGRGRSGTEDRPGVAQPDVAEPAVDDLDIGDPGKTRPGVIQRVRLADHQLDEFPARSRQGADQGLDLGPGRFEVLLPQLAVAGPADPHGAVWRPFGGDGSGHRGG